MYIYTIIHYYIQLYTIIYDHIHYHDGNPNEHQPISPVPDYAPHVLARWEAEL